MGVMTLLPPLMACASKQLLISLKEMNSIRHMAANHARARASAQLYHKLYEKSGSGNIGKEARLTRLAVAPQLLHARWVGSHKLHLDCWVDIQHLDFAALLPVSCQASLGDIPISLQEMMRKKPKNPKP